MHCPDSDGCFKAVVIGYLGFCCCPAPIPMIGVIVHRLAGGPIRESCLLLSTVGAELLFSHSKKYRQGTLMSKVENELSSIF